VIVSLIVAVAETDGAIGHQGGLPWHLPADLARFKKLTMGHTLIMGRRTFESLEGRTLPGRKIIVLSRHLKEIPAGAHGLSPNLMAAIRQAQFEFEEEEAFIAGGAQVYAQALAKELVDRIYLTEVEASVPADTYFPAYDLREWEVISSEHHPADDNNPYAHNFQILEFVGPKPAA
jgi:dihydrofolate reductase